MEKNDLISRAAVLKEFDAFCGEFRGIRKIIEDSPSVETIRVSDYESEAKELFRRADEIITHIVRLRLNGKWDELAAAEVQFHEEQLVVDMQQFLAFLLNKGE